MNTKTLAVVLVALAVAGGAWYWYMGVPRESAQDDWGTYAYQCDNGAQFTMSPASNMLSLRLTPGQGATFATATLVQTSTNAGARYEGSGIVFVGVGEGVTLTLGGATLKCNPEPRQDIAPFNWGDAGEGGGVTQDTSLIVGESVLGKWQSTQDPKFVREFKGDGTAEDSYGGSVVSGGTWKVFTKANAPANFSYPITDDSVYLQMTMQGTQGDTLNFRVAKMTPEELQLVYLDRGGVLDFKSIK